MGQRHVRKQLMAEINVVPYIDVMLVLLVIFMITAPLLSQGIQVDLPTAASEPIERQNKEPLVVAVDKDGLFYLNFGSDQDQGISPEKLVQRVAAVLRHQPGTPVYVKGDSAVSYGKVVVAMSLLQKAGAPSVGLLTKAPDNAPVNKTSGKTSNDRKNK